MSEKIIYRILYTICGTFLLAILFWKLADKL
jgi:hypothetical protein